MITPSVSMHF